MPNALEQANGITDLLERAPLAGFLSLTVLAIVVLFWLLLREVKAHNATLREVLPLLTAISAQWKQQLDVMGKLSTLLEKLNTDRARPRRSAPDLPKVEE